MRPEEVPAELVEKAEAALALAQERWLAEWDGHRTDVFSVMARHALAAVLPEVQAQARRDVGVELANDGMQQFDPVPAWAIRYLKHATATEEPTT